MQATSAALVVLPLAACVSRPLVPVEQDDLLRFVAQTFPAGMAMDQVMVRMSAEGFLCGQAVGPEIVCGRKQPRLLRSDCLESVTLVRSNDAVPVLKSAAAATVCRKY